MDTQQVVLPSSQFMYLVSMLSQKKRGGKEVVAQEGDLIVI